MQDEDTTRPDNLWRCPRCQAEGAEPNGDGAWSHAASELGPLVAICSRCGQREKMREQYAGMSIPPTEWPVSIENLLFEERLLLEHHRKVNRELLLIPTADGVDEPAEPTIAQRIERYTATVRREMAG